MATFEERELVDYTFKKVQEFMDKDFVIKDLDKMHDRIKKLEENYMRLVERSKNLENRIRNLEEKSRGYAPNIFDR